MHAHMYLHAGTGVPVSRPAASVTVGNGQETGQEMGAARGGLLYRHGQGAWAWEAGASREGRR